MTLPRFGSVFPNDILKRLADLETLANSGVLAGSGGSGGGGGGGSGNDNAAVHKSTSNIITAMTTVEEYASTFASSWTARTARGSSGTPTALLAGDPVGPPINFGGHNGFGFLNSIVSIGAVASDTLGLTHAGTALAMKTTYPGAALYSAGTYGLGDMVVSGIGGSIYQSTTDANAVGPPASHPEAWQLVAPSAAAVERFHLRPTGGFSTGDLPLINASYLNEAQWAFARPGSHVDWYPVGSTAVGIHASSKSFDYLQDAGAGRINTTGLNVLYVADPDTFGFGTNITAGRVTFDGHDKHALGGGWTGFQAQSWTHVCNHLMGTFAANTMVFQEMSSCDRYYWLNSGNYFIGDQVIFGGTVYECLIANGPSQPAGARAPNAGLSDPANIPALGTSPTPYWKHVGVGELTGMECDYGDRVPVMWDDGSLSGRVDGSGNKIGGGWNYIFRNDGANDIDAAMFIYNDPAHTAAYLDGLVCSTNPKTPPGWNPDTEAGAGGNLGTGLGWRLGDVMLFNPANWTAGEYVPPGQVRVAALADGLDGHFYYDLVYDTPNWAANDGGVITTQYALGELVARYDGTHWHLFQCDTGWTAGDDPLTTSTPYANPQVSHASWIDLGANHGITPVAPGTSPLSDIFWRRRPLASAWCGPSFMYRPSAPTPPKTISAMTWVSGVMYITTTAPHQFEVGQNVAVRDVVSSVTPSSGPGAWNTFQNNRYYPSGSQPKISSVISATQFAISNAYPVNPATAGGSITSSPIGYVYRTNSNGDFNLFGNPPGGSTVTWSFWNPAGEWNQGVRRYFLWLGPTGPEFHAGQAGSGSDNPRFSVDALGNVICESLTVNAGASGGTIGFQQLTGSTSQTLLHNYGILELNALVVTSLTAPPAGGTIADGSNGQPLRLINRSANNSTITLWDNAPGLATNLQLQAVNRRLYYGGVLDLVFVQDITGGGGASYWQEVGYSSGIGPLENAPVQVYNTGMIGNQWPGGMWSVTHIANLTDATATNNLLGSYLNYSPDVLLNNVNGNPTGVHAVNTYTPRLLLHTGNHTAGALYLDLDDLTTEATGGVLTGFPAAPNIGRWVNHVYRGSGGQVTSWADEGIRLDLAVTGNAQLSSRVGIHAVDATVGPYVLTGFTRTPTVQVNGVGLQGQVGQYPFTLDEVGATVTGTNITGGGANVITTLDYDDGTGHFAFAVINDGNPAGSAFTTQPIEQVTITKANANITGQSLTTQTIIKIDALSAAGAGTPTVNRGIDNAASLWQSGEAHFGSSAQLFVSNIGGILSNSSGGIKASNPVGGIGYATGAGGIYAQPVAPGLKSATVTASGATKTSGQDNAVSGNITTSSVSLAAATIVSFQFTNTSIAATDQLEVNHQSGGTVGAYTLNAACAAGSARIYIRNATAGALAEALVIKYNLVRGATA